MRRSLARDTLYYAAASPARVKAPRAAKLPQMTLPLGATSGGIKVFWGFSLGSTSEWGHPRKPQNDPQSTHRMEMKWKQILAPLPTAHGRDRLGMALACTLLHFGGGDESPQRALPVQSSPHFRESKPAPRIERRSHRGVAHPRHTVRPDPNKDVRKSSGSNARRRGDDQPRSGCERVRPRR